MLAQVLIAKIKMFPHEWVDIDTSKSMRGAKIKASRYNVSNPEYQYASGMHLGAPTVFARYTPNQGV